MMQTVSSFATHMRPIFSIVVAQLFGTSLWFSANGAAADLMRDWGLGASDIGLLTNAVQLGFIVGTLSFSLSGLADRFEASKIFAVCAVLGALFNAAFAWCAHGLPTGLPLRFLVGFCLAGVYPLGMKLVVSWVPEKAGNALSQLIAMLVLGTALPYGLRVSGGQWPWQASILASSLLAVIAAAMMLRLGDGPHLKRHAGTPPFNPRRILQSFAIPQFRASAFGYFGHMWEIYAFWTLLPLLIVSSGIAAAGNHAVAGWAFVVMSMGALGCIAGGMLSHRFGSARVGGFMLALSGLCCALYPFSDSWSHFARIVLLLTWGMSVAADSPHFSALSAKACPPELVGGALALQNAIGFAISMVSIQLGTGIVATWGDDVTWLLLPGPVLGVIGFLPLLKRKRDALR
ncbi:MAG TPA: MFS transporter [Oxalicibacterium sp.]|jgi:MFS family permease|nr:MFS transporter [Oxalicibacterium sp.]